MEREHIINEYTKHNKPDMLIIDHKKKRIRVVEASIPWDENVNKKYEEKNEKYQTVRQELRKQYEVYELQQVNVIIGELGTITTLSEELAKISKKAVKAALEIVCRLISSIRRLQINKASNSIHHRL